MPYRLPSVDLAQQSGHILGKVGITFIGVAQHDADRVVHAWPLDAIAVRGLQSVGLGYVTNHEYPNDPMSYLLLDIALNRRLTDFDELDEW